MSLIILEGPDGAGKTHLAEYLATNHDFKVEHHHARQDEVHIAKYYMDSMILANELRVVMDRSWLSEEPYMFFTSPNRVKSRVHDVQGYLEQMARRRYAVVILFMPPFNICRARWQDRPGEYFRNADVLSKVYVNYLRGIRTALPILRCEDPKYDPELLFHRACKLREAAYPVAASRHFPTL